MAAPLHLVSVAQCYFVQVEVATISHVVRSFFVIIFVTIFVTIFVSNTDNTQIIRGANIHSLRSLHANIPALAIGTCRQ